MKISIVTISYNQKDYLPACLSSVGGQLEPGDQHIIVDPGSQDGSRDLIKEYTQRVAGASAVFENDSGPADGLNNGFKHAAGELFAYVNADDFILPGTLQYVRSFFATNSKFDVLIGAIKMADGNGKMGRRGRVADHPNIFRLANDCLQYYQQGTFFKKDAFEAVNGFNILNRTCWDRELIVDMLLNGNKFKVDSKPLAAFRIHGASITGSGTNAANYLADGIRIRSKIGKIGQTTVGSTLGSFLKMEARFNPLRILRQYRPVS